MYPAHTRSLEIHLGHKKPDGLDTCHSCDNPPCVNPHHLRFGTRVDNVGDAVSRGRNPEGPTHGSRKLEAPDVVDIFRRADRGERYSDIAADFGVTKGTITSIVNGHTWKSMQHINPRNQTQGERP